jgi:putative ABC transport system substrate-binding protein
MKRLAVTLLALALLTAPLAAEAQQAKKIPRIGFLSTFSPSDNPLWHEGFRQGLRELGYIQGENISIEYRWAEGKEERLPALAADLVRLNVDLILVETTPASLAAKQATTTIPIVMTIVADPLANGLVRSLARPGGNITGMSLQQTDLTAKRVQLLKEVVPTISRLGILWNPASPITRRQFAEAEAAARVLGLQLISLEVRTPDDFERVFRAATGAGVGALLVLDDFLLVIHHARITALAIKARLPALSTVTEFALAGGLMGYAVNLPDVYRRSMTYVDRILKGAKPADLPVQQPSKFELVINLKTAKALGLTIPPSVLARADEVIE